MFAPERLNVLLSRARNALIMIGNATTFTHARKGGDLWTRLFTQLTHGGHIYDGFPVQCQQHPDRVGILSEPDDFVNKCPDGGCTEPWLEGFSMLHLRTTLTFYHLPVAQCFDVGSIRVPPNVTRSPTTRR